MKFTNTYFYRCADNPFIRFPKPWDTYTTLPVSVPISEWLCRTRLTPNQISIISLVIAIISAGVFVIGTPVALIIGALLFQLSYILDCADGYKARKMNMSSKLGHWIDHTFDEIKKPILMIGIYLGQNALHPLPAWAWIGGFLYLFSRVLVKTDSTVKKAPAAADESARNLSRTAGSNMLLTPRQTWLFQHFGIVTLFTSIEAQAIAFVVGPICQLPMLGFLVAGCLSILWVFTVDGVLYWRRALQSERTTVSR
ncbi:CDP-alcohol phosphatidyltransferase family protein [Alicyclobacillus dauci]|uniref:CDP-alcohol phosphatidyltransferase family protein n=1 Tax=Alicyclobacillus dauci TaxID=1475485 RepID=A0ABY6Z0B2_9BACL|nr:CDP-alcohol phosphatidyltransferase family protein [Alicyclobacillus dauci]WAH36013.1 CDP-alcohol phosphatidyltransferase family protein [Alicyclobacillus dauci]